MRRTPLPRLLRLVLAFAVIFAAGTFPACSCDNSGQGNGDGGDGGDDASMDDLAGSGTDDGGGDMAQAVVVPSTDGGCTASGNSCATSSECCSGVCDSTKHCVAGMCAPNSGMCKVATDCCKLNCAGGVCATTQCLADNALCTAGGAACCSTQCVAGACKPLSTTCKTAGNPCPNGNGDCCSKLCTGGFCAAPSQVSYCTQPGDICFYDNDCCTGVCAGATATVAGTCATIATTCSVDGTVCTGCTGCCSSFCAPFGASGSRICQPASGCHVQGDLCHVNSDCCGGDIASGLPGAGLVLCVADPTYKSIGTCSQSNNTCGPSGPPTCKNTCQAEGDVCHDMKITTGCTSNSFPANCCGSPGQSKGVCKLDKLGVPRCYGLTGCVMVGGACASAADCCFGVPCLPDATGALKCNGPTMTCSPSGGVCTTTSDCCTGYQCILPPGSLKGTCTNPNFPPPPADMAGFPTDLAGVDLAGSSTDLATPPPPPPTCALYGQSCSTTTPCCGTTSCLSPYSATPSSAACAPGEMDCTCYDKIL